MTTREKGDGKTACHQSWEERNAGTEMSSPNPRGLGKRRKNPSARHGAEACSFTFTLAGGPAGASFSEANICLSSRLCSTLDDLLESSFSITRIRTRDAYKMQWHV